MPVDILALIVVALPIVFAVTGHEVAHGWVARALGDATAERQGRLSLNPIKHVDPIGTLLVPIVLYLLHGAAFGWAKPVPIDWRNLRQPRRDFALVALAGPAANLVMALLWLLLLAIFERGLAPGVGGVLRIMCWAGIMSNAIIMAINLIPIPPLDGSRVVTALLPARTAVLYNRIGPYGLLVMVLLLITGTLERLLGPVLAIVETLVAGATVL